MSGLQYKYRVIKTSDYEPERLEEYLNYSSREGWRLTGSTNEVLVLERLSGLTEAAIMDANMKKQGVN